MYNGFITRLKDFYAAKILQVFQTRNAANVFSWND